MIKLTIVVVFTVITVVDHGGTVFASPSNGTTLKRFQVEPQSKAETSNIAYESVPPKDKESLIPYHDAGRNTYHEGKQEPKGSKDRKHIRRGYTKTRHRIIEHIEETHFHEEKYLKEGREKDGQYDEDSSYAEDRPVFQHGTNGVNLPFPTFQKNFHVSDKFPYWAITPDDFDKDNMFVYVKEKSPPVSSNKMKVYLHNHPPPDGATYHPGSKFDSQVNNVLENPSSHTNSFRLVEIPVVIEGLSSHRSRHPASKGNEFLPKNFVKPNPGLEPPTFVIVPVPLTTHTGPSFPIGGVIDPHLLRRPGGHFERLPNLNNLHPHKRNILRPPLNKFAGPSQNKPPRLLNVPYQALRS